jgi:hypothetical protein
MPWTGLFCPEGRPRAAVVAPADDDDDVDGDDDDDVSAAGCWSVAAAAGVA